MTFLGSPVSSFLRSRHRKSCSSVASMLFEMELENEGEDEKECRPARRTRARLSPRYHKVQELLALQRTRPEEAALWQAAHKAKYMVEDEDGDVDLEAFAQALANAGWTLWLRTGTEFGEVPELSGAALRHRFLVVQLPSLELAIVDPDWKSKFVIASPTEEYQSVMGLLPDVFVGTAVQLNELTKALCAEMEAVFNERDIPIPPWRQHRAMAARWLVSASEDVKVEPMAAEE